MFEPLDTSDVVEFPVAVGKLPRQVATPDLDPLQAKYLRIQIAAANIKPGANHARRQRPLPPGNVEQHTPRELAENLRHHIMNGLVRHRRGFAFRRDARGSIRCPVTTLLSA